MILPSQEFIKKLKDVIIISQEEILIVLKRLKKPCSLTELSIELGINRKAIFNSISGLLKYGEISALNYQGKQFFILNNFQIIKKEKK